MATPTLFTSNRAESLASALAKNIHKPLASPFAPEIIVVPNQNVARWLRLELAREHEISANYWFPFPKHFALWLFSSTFPDLAGETSPFEPESLVWVVFKVLPEMVEQPDFTSLKNYLGDDLDPRKLFQLSDRVARLFDQYLIFRPDMLLEWDNGKGDGWQPILWRKITGTLDVSHPAALRKMFLELASKSGTTLTKPPERISVFGTSALPKFYLEMFEALAVHTEISLYLLQPCAEWWGDISSDRETEKTLQRLGEKSRVAAALHFERGNRLLASLGQQGREFLRLLHEFDWVQQDISEPVEEDSLLHCVQSDIFNLCDRGADGSEKTIASSGDNSIRVHNCHSPLREVEVLHDHILDWLQHDPALTPRDILVMTPDIDAYAPFIQAVFESPEHTSHRIPIHIADSNLHRRSGITETFLKILALPQTRLGVTDILSILEVPAVRERFALTEGNLGIIRSWIEETGIRWGRDAAQRAALDLPKISDHTWEHGLNRLLLGYAIAGENQKLCNGILPFDEIEGDHAIALGRFADFLEKLFNTVEQLKAPRTLSAWSDFLHDVLETFFQPHEKFEPDLQVIRRICASLIRVGEISSFEGALGVDVIEELLSRRLDEEPGRAGHSGGGVTFCSLRPGRSLPFQVVCLLGMNDNAFPRATSWLSFDLTAQNPQLGDRSSREDDRYLFLETLISAREKLHISYVGQSIRDNSPAPPSVLVNQLLDYLEQGFAAEETIPIADHVVTRHRLQAFSPEYFSGGRLFSYSRDNLFAGQAAGLARSAPKPFLTDALPAAEDEFRQVSLDALADFFCHPAKFLATRRLGIVLPGLKGGLTDIEPFALESLDGYQLKQFLLESCVAGRALHETTGLIRASGVLPAGLPGEAAFGNARRAVEGFYSKLKPHLAETITEARPFEMAVGDFQVTGQFTNITGAGLLSFRVADVKPKDLLRAWIHHVAWNASATGHPQASKLMGTDLMYDFSGIENPKAMLESLLGIYWRGLNTPLKFFPKASFAFCEAQGNSRKDPRAAARKEWEGNEFYGIPGEGSDEYINLFFRNAEPFDEEFAALAKEVFLPLLAHGKKTEA